MKMKYIFIFLSIINCSYVGKVLSCKRHINIPTTTEQSVKIREIACKYGEQQEVLRKLYGELRDQENSGISRKNYEKYGDIFVLFILLNDGAMEKEKEKLISYVIDKGGLNLLKKHNDTPVAATFLFFAGKEIGQYIINTYFSDKEKRLKLCDSIPDLYSDKIRSHYPLLCQFE